MTGTVQQRAPTRSVFEDILVRDIMTTDVVTVGPGEPVPVLIERFVGNGITGAPVVTGSDRLVGVVSASDVLGLARHELEESELDRLIPDDVAERWGTFFLDPAAGPPEATFRGLTAAFFEGWTVNDIMTPATFSVRPDASLAELARFLMRTGTHRALVTQAGALLGIVSMTDIVRAVAETDA